MDSGRDPDQERRTEAGGGGGDMLDHELQQDSDGRI